MVMDGDSGNAEWVDLVDKMVEIQDDGGLDAF